MTTGTTRERIATAAVRNSLPLHGSCHPDHQNSRVHRQCTNILGYRCVIPWKQCLALLNPA
ncbi:hypothetical protein, partial [Micromonospora fulviviridis]